MSFPWIDNRKKKEVEKTTKYAPLRWELKQQFPTYTVKQFNIISDLQIGVRGRLRVRLFRTEHAL